MLRQISGRCADTPESMSIDLCLMLFPQEKLRRYTVAVNMHAVFFYRKISCYAMNLQIAILITTILTTFTTASKPFVTAVFRVATRYRVCAANIRN
jgi:hypothetical protein